LDGLDLLGDGGEDALLEAVELVKAAPRAALAQTHEDATDGLRRKSKKKTISRSQEIILCRKQK
jgi:hypothetical protein